jgi:hypothetical protein
MRPPVDPTAQRARALLTDEMTTTLPSLADLLDTWRAGLSAEPAAGD